MFEEEKNIKKIVFNKEFNTIEIEIESTVKKNGKVEYSKIHGQAFNPNDINKVKEYIGVSDGPEIDYLNVAWDAPAIEKYNKMIEKQDKKIEQ